MHARNPGGRHAKPKPDSGFRRRHAFGSVLLAMLMTFVFGTPVAQADGEEGHPSISDVVVTNETNCGDNDGTIKPEVSEDRKDKYIYTYDVIPGQDNGYSQLDETETSLAPGDYDVQLLKRKSNKHGGDYEDWEPYGETTTVTVHPCQVTVSASGDCETVSVTYVNPTEKDYWGDIRVDGEAGEADAHSTTVKSEGPPPLTAFGLRYQDVPIPAGETVVHEENFSDGSGEHTVAYRVARGAERRWYSIGWNEITVDCGETEPEPGPQGPTGPEGPQGEKGDTPEPATSDKDCTDFDNVAQVVFHLTQFPGDFDRMDGDDDGFACNSHFGDGADEPDDEDDGIVVPTRINTGR